MSRLREYFESAGTVDAAERQVGLEVETLFVDASGRPLEVAAGRRVFDALGEAGWRDTEAGPAGWRLCRDGFVVTPEVAAGNIEVITPPHAVSEISELLVQTVKTLRRLYTIAETVDARPMQTSHDGFPEVDNVLLHDDRDRKWAGVDGREALRVLGHIASVHVTVDLQSIDEGFALIRRVDALRRRRGWPGEQARTVWHTYLQRSRADYEKLRYGAVPTRFEDYLARLRRLRVVMNRDADGRLRRPDARVAARDIEETLDIPLSLGTVWFHTRLRVINDTLALEIRCLPRGSDARFIDDVSELVGALFGDAGG